MRAILTRNILMSNLVCRMSNSACTIRFAALYFLYKARIEFNTQSMATPVSANTAIHIFA